jgi:general L-amino acid transport system permease protein
MNFVSKTIIPAAPPPAHAAGAWGWVRNNLLSSPTNILLTLIGLYLAFQAIYTIVDFTLVKAVWSGKDRDACLEDKIGRTVGACWPYVAAKWRLFIYGFYEFDEIYRVNIVFFIAALLLTPLLIPKLPFKVVNAIAFFIIFPFFAFYLLVGKIPFTTTLAYLCYLCAVSYAVYTLIAPKKKQPLLIAVSAFIIGYILHQLNFGALPHVETSKWGGFLISLVVAVTGIVVSMPLSILLALGRRSELPIIKSFCVGFIELVRSVPLITILFFATYMLPFFIPRSWSPDGLLRVLIGVSLFSAAYLAEVIRGGLQAIPKGQFEGAQALGLSYPKMMGLVVLPQALKHVIPGIVNTFIGLFKDTTLVSIVSIMDLLGQIRTSFSDPKWSTPTTFFTGFAFAGLIYFIFCYAMSRYSMFIEKRLNTGHKR